MEHRLPTSAAAAWQPARRTGNTLLALLASVVLIHAQPAGEYAPIANPEQAGQELAAMARSLIPAENVRATGVLRILQRDAEPRTIPFTSEVKLGPPQPAVTTWDVQYRTQPAPNQPAETLLVRFHVGQSNQYFFARGALPEAAQLDQARAAGAQLEVPLAGSDFWLCDLGLEFLHWPDQKVVKTEMRRGRVCRLLESVNPRPTPRGYGRVQSWIDLEQGGVLQAEAYDRDHRLLKEFTLGSVKKVEGQWQVKDMKIVQVPTRSRTWLEFDLTQ